MSLRKRVWKVLEVAEEGDRFSRFIDYGLFFLVGANVLAIILESVPSLYADYRDLFRAFDLFSVSLFTVEYLLRLWSCIEDPLRRKDTAIKTRFLFMGSGIALIDLIAILPFYFQFLFPGIDLRFLRVLRMLRILKLTRYSSALNLLLRVLYQERAAFGATFSILIMVLIVVSCGIYLVEYEAQPEAFGSIPAAMWWAVATLTTVGYGDVTPITAMGKLFGSVVTIVGVGMVALPAGILASSFSEMLRRRQQEYRLSVKQALEDGKITDEEEAQLEQIRIRLNLSPLDSEELRQQTKQEIDVEKDYETDLFKEIEGETVREAEARLEKDLEKILDRGIVGHPGVCPHCGSALPDDYD